MLKNFIFGVLLLFQSSNIFSLENSYKVTILGTGYVGLVLGTGLAELGHTVICADIDEEKITRKQVAHRLQQGIIPIYEPGLTELIKKNVAAQKLEFTYDLEGAIQASEIIFLAVGTPQSSDGKADISQILAVANTIADNINSPKIVCTKSTVPIGTGNRIKSIMKEKNVLDLVTVVSNPEFLREGSAVFDFFNPDRIVIGSDTTQSKEIMQNLYAPLIENKVPFLATDIVTAEAIKYASNGFLAVKISYINELANLCEKVGANCEDLSRGMGLDKRIGHQFLKPGPGFGGSCFPKDTHALLKSAEEVGVNLSVVRAAIDTNELQKLRVVERICSILSGDVNNKTISILGLAFKANTDDVRESSAITVIQELLKKGAIVKAYDPIAMINMQKIIPNIDYCPNVVEAAQDADMLVVLTEWDEFKTLDAENIYSVMNQPIIFDTRNILPHEDLRNIGFTCNVLGQSSKIN